MSDTYKSIAETVEGIYKEKGSKFLAFAIPVSTIDDIKTLLEKYRKDYFDARHVCYAYMLGAEKKEFRCNDDGEPSGTAGKPILGRILSADLSDILIIVVRYFGGTKLGTSGLITAYKTASEDALNNATIIEKVLKSRITIEYDYLVTSQVQKVFKDFDADLISSEFTSICKNTIEIPLSTKDSLCEKLKKIESVVIKDENEG